MAKSPCFNTDTKTDCPNRKSGCQCNCKDWKTYTGLRNAEYEQRKKETLARNISFDNHEKRLLKKQISLRTGAGRHSMYGK